MRIGYSFWGFLGDQKFEGGREVSTPDGNAAYSWAIVWEAMRRGHVVLPMQRDRDAEGWSNLDVDLFSSFSLQKRTDAYLHLRKTGSVYKSWTGHPELDVLLVEWRWPIPGRNTRADRGKPGYQEDLERQTSLLRHYLDLGVPVILWDLDHKLTKEDELRWRPHAVFETSNFPKIQHLHRTFVEPPFVVSDLLQHETLPVDPKRKLVYVGSRYERDDVIDELIEPYAKLHPGEVEFWGKWEEADQRWPDISYHGRIGMKDFRQAYGTAVAVPLLGKREYLERGFVTPRPAEAVLFGSVPVGFDRHLGIDLYTQYCAGEYRSLEDIVGHLAEMTVAQRKAAREETAHLLERTDARFFVDAIEEVANAVPALDLP